MTGVFSFVSHGLACPCAILSSGTSKTQVCHLSARGYIFHVCSRIEKALIEPAGARQAAGLFRVPPGRQGPTGQPCATPIGYRYR